MRETRKSDGPRGLEGKRGSLRMTVAPASRRQSGGRLARRREMENERGRVLARGMPGGAKELHAFADFPILTREEQQGLALAHNHFLHLSDEDRVIARILRCVQTALEVCQPALQNRCSMAGALKLRPRFFGSAVVGAGGARIVFRNLSLILSQYIHAEAFLRVQMGVRPRFLIDA